MKKVFFAVMCVISICAYSATWPGHGATIADLEKYIAEVGEPQNLLDKSHVESARELIEVKKKEPFATYEDLQKACANLKYTKSFQYALYNKVFIKEAYNEALIKQPVYTIIIARNPRSKGILNVTNDELFTNIGPVVLDNPKVLFTYQLANSFVDVIGDLQNIPDEDVKKVLQKMNRYFSQKLLTDVANKAECEKLVARIRTILATY